MGALGWTSDEPIPATIVDAKGDLIVATAADTPTRLPVGTSGQALRANPATPTGLEWDTLTASDVGGVPTTRAINTANGLTGGGDLSADRTIEPVYGMTANTVAEGDDTRIVNAIQQTILDAKGDLIAASAADTPSRLPVGLNGQVLTANNLTDTGLEWQTPASDAVISVNGETGAVILDAADVGAPPTTRAINTANGLTGGGDLSADRTIEPVYGTTSNTVAEGDDTRIVGAQQRSTLTTKGDLYVATAAATTTRQPVGTDGQVLRADSGTGTGLTWDTLDAADVGAVAPTRAVNTANGLQGGGDLSADRTISPVYGATANTVAEGDDTRIVNAIQQTLFDAKGDLIAASAADTPIRLPVGANGFVLVANSATASGLEWVEVSSLVSPSSIMQRTTTGDITVNTAYLRNVMLNNDTDAASVVVRAGGAGGTVILELNATADPTIVCEVDNALCTNGIHVTLTGGGTPNVTVVYAEV